MYDLTIVAAIIGGLHFAAAFLAVDVLKLTYQQYLVAIGIFGIVSGLIAKGIMFAWKDRIASIIRGEEQTGELGIDAIGFFTVLIVTGIASIYIVRRRYGWAGYAGALGVNMVANAII